MNYKRCVSIKEAREIIAKVFRDDPYFRKTYEANIAMLIYDDQTSTSGRVTGGYEERSSTDLNTIPGCNEIADRLLTLIFGDVVVDISKEIDTSREIINKYQMLDI